MKKYFGITFLLVSLTAVSFAQWTSIGGPGGGGLIHTLFIDKTTTPHTVYTAFLAEGGIDKGLFKSTDGGDHWTKVPVDTTKIVSIRTMAIGPTGILYAGGENMFRSTDKGATWTATKSSLYGFVRSIAVESATIVYAGTDGGPYKSTDGGVTWAAAGSGFLARTFVVSESIGNLYIGVFGKGVFKSTDSGTSWSLAKGGMTDSNIVTLVLESPGVLYVGTSDGYVGKVMRTSDGGANWSVINTGLPVNPSIASLVIESPGVIYAGGLFANIYKTTNSGTSWTKLNQTMTGVVSYFALDDPGTVYAGIENYTGGIFKTTDGGGTWQQMSPNLYSIINLAWNENTGTLYALVKDIGVFKTTNNGKSWIDINTNLTNKSMNSIVVENPSSLYLAGTKGNIFKTTNDGTTWTDLSVDSTTGNVTSFIIEKAGTFFAGVEYAGIFRSTDDGVTWYKMLAGLTSAATEFQIENPGVLYARTSSGIKKTENDGVSWVSRSYVTIGVELGFASHIALESPGVLYASMKTSMVKGIYKSTDSAITWKGANSGLSDWDISSFAVASPGLVFASSNSKGVFKTTNGGTNWVDVSAGITEKQVKVLAMSSNAIFAGTLSGIFKTTRPTEVKENDQTRTPETFGLTQNYPNPFNPATTIQYQLPANSYTTLKVYDILGKEVDALVHEEQKAGRYTVNYNASMLSSGMYFYRLQSGNFVETKRMIVIK